MEQPSLSGAKRQHSEGWAAGICTNRYKDKPQGPGRAPSPVTTHALAYVHSYVAVLHVPFILQIQRYETVVLFTSLCILDF